MGRKKILPARRYPQKTAGIGVDLHIIDSTKYDTGTLDVEGNGVPRLRVENSGISCTLFFETTDQVQELVDTLKDYLSRNEVKR